MERLTQIRMNSSFQLKEKKKKKTMHVCTKAYLCKTCSKEKKSHAWKKEKKKKTI